MIPSEGGRSIGLYDVDCGGFATDFVRAQPFGVDSLSRPQQAITGPDGLVHVSDRLTNNSVLRFDRDGASVDVFANPNFTTIHGLSFSPVDGTLLVAGPDHVERFDTGSSSLGAFIGVEALGVYAMDTGQTLVSTLASGAGEMR